MRTASGTLSTYLDANTLADRVWHLVTITPRTGSVVRLTDADANITHGGQTYTAGGTGTAPLVVYRKRREVAGTEIGACSLSLLCGEGAQFNGVRLPLAAAQGVLDKAAVEILRYFPAVSESMHLFAGQVANATPSSTAVDLDIESGLAALNVQIPRRIYQPGCNNMLFDAACGLVEAAFTATGAAAAGSTQTVINSNRFDVLGYWALGRIAFTSGQNSGIVRAVTIYQPVPNGAFTVDIPLPYAPAAGDTFSVVPGCDKRLSTCRAKFGADNSPHFAGQPFVPLGATREQ